MKKIFAFFLMCSLLFIIVYQVKAQKEFAPIGSKWYYTHDAVDFKGNYKHYVSDRDTVIEGKDCRIVNKYYTQSNTPVDTFILMQDGGKVYHYFCDRFNLLFDFDAKVGDSLEFGFRYNKYELRDYPNYKDTIVSARYVVKSISAENIGGVNLKHISVFIIDKTQVIDTIYHIPPIGYSYMEMIGGYYDMIHICKNISELLYTDNIRCYTDSDVSIVSEWWDKFSLPCDYSTGVSVETLNKESTFKIYPNPAKDIFYVSADENGVITVRNALGLLLYSSHIRKGLNEISIDNISNGLIFIEIKDEKEKLQTYKIIKR